MRFKLDENLGGGAARLLQESGHDAATVHSEGLAGASDRAVMEACVRERRCLITLDLEFANPVLFDPRGAAGIVAIRLPEKPSRDDLRVALRTLVEGLRKERVEGRLWVIRGSRIRVHEAGQDEPT